MDRRCLVVFAAGLLLFCFGRVAAQPQLSVQHYGTEDGLPQKAVVDMLQDHKGFMWFATSASLCKFDGTTFHPYRVAKNPDPLQPNIRFDRIQLDTRGYIWIWSRENGVFRFDPRREQFVSLNSVAAFKNQRLAPGNVISTASGKTWLLGLNNGCYCFKDTTLNPIALGTANHTPGSGRVMKIFEDRDKNSWILTAKGLYQYSADLKLLRAYFTNAGFYCAAETNAEIWFGSNDGAIYRYHKASKQFSLTQTGAKAAIRVLAVIDKRRMLVAASVDDFFIKDMTTGTDARFKISLLGHTAVTNIRSCYIDRRKNIWFETPEPGISMFNTTSGEFKHFKLATENFADHPFSPRLMIWEDSNNRLWIQQYQGGFGYYDPGKNELYPVSDIVPINTNPFSGMLYAGFSDKQGNLWISTRSQGVEKIVFPDSTFRELTVDPTGNNHVRSMMEDVWHRIWVATKDGKITIFNHDLSRLGCLTEQGAIGKGKSLINPAYSMITDARGVIWIGTKGKGIYRLTTTNQGKSYTVHHYINNKNDPYSLSDDKIYCIFQDRQQRIWIGTYSHGINLADDKIDGRFYNFQSSFNNTPASEAKLVRSISEDHNGMLYVGTTSGLLVFPSRLAKKGPQQYRFYQYSRHNGSLSGNDIYDVCVTHDNNVYLAVSRTGLDWVAARDKQGYPTRFINYPVRSGLVPELTSQIREDNKHRLWIVSESNLMRFNPQRQTFANYPDIANAIRGDNFSEGGDITTTDGRILLGTSGGVVVIYPQKIKPDTFKPYVALTGFQLANRSVPVGSSSPLTQNIDELKSIKLDYKQNFITIEYAALDFARTKQIRYAYRLDGVDSNWVYTREQNAKYIHLAPGNYTFHVKSTNGQGLWLANEHQLQIIVVPAIWQTWWAKLLYALLGLGLIVFISRWIITFYRLKDRLQLEKEQTEMKTSFFTDISHEIRTPLTLVVSPVEYILENESVSETVSDQLRLVLKNSRRMLRLVNQILDFRKIQHQLLMVREVAIGEQVTGIANEFVKAAGGESIRFKIHDQTAGTKIWVDPDGIEKLLFNLFTNAVKHSPGGSTIEVNLFIAGEKVGLQVKDYGRGMNSEILKKLFSRFVSYNPDKTKPSTGIGLSIVKEIVDRHVAEIQVESKENEGTSFTILFLAGVAHFKGMPNVAIANNDLSEVTASINSSVPAPACSNDNERETILLVEDDEDMRNYIAGMLSANYKVLKAENGETGLTIALREVPDFIISDIMMPKMTGFEFLNALRNTPLISHIPLFFFTETAATETELAAYEQGADAFITKPFGIKLLQSQIRAIMAQRNRRYVEPLQHTTTPVNIVKPQPKRSTDLNDRFLSKIRQEIEKNISNPDFSVDHLIAIMPMSRTVFVKKLKSLTQQGPVEYIRTIKIKYAANLIDTTDYSIKEISYMVGIHDTKYFSQRFKEIMGMLPKDYKKQHHDDGVANV